MGDGNEDGFLLFCEGSQEQNGQVFFKAGCVLVLPIAQCSAGHARVLSLVLRGLATSM